MTKSMIFHHWQPMGASPASGTANRTANMLQAFDRLGYETESLTGDAKERKATIQHLEKEISAGRQFDFLYSESANLPLSLNHHSRVRMSNLDFRFFGRLRQHNIAVGLFYRDILWRFDQHYWNLAKESQLKRKVTNSLYWYDWLHYLNRVDHLFLPSLAMNAYMPTEWKENQVSALPPGCTLEHESVLHVRTEFNPADLNLFFVGGIMPHRSDLKEGIDAVQRLEGVHLTLCCRESEWAIHRLYYKPIDPHAVKIIHRQGKELIPYFKHADLFFLYWKPTTYLSFAVPIKIFEALGYGLPIVTNSGTEAARIVRDENIGWVVSTPDELRQLLLDLRDDRTRIDRKREQILAVRHKHTWQARAETVADTLTKLRASI